jgi:hypothetical protein
MVTTIWNLNCFMFELCGLYRVPQLLQLAAFESAIVAVHRRLEAEHSRWEKLQRRMIALHDRILGTRARGAEVCGECQLVSSDGWLAVCPDSRDCNSRDGVTRIHFNSFSF